MILLERIMQPEFYLNILNIKLKKYKWLDCKTYIDLQKKIINSNDSLDNDAVKNIISSINKLNLH